MSFLSRVQKHLAAGLACGLESSLDQINESNVNDWQLELNVAKVTWRFVVLAVVRWTDETWFNNTHVRVHQTLSVCVTIILVGIWSLDLNRGHLTDLNRVHQAETNLCDSLWY